MGNFHCIPSSCAEVNYREYEASKIRWRYGNEPWQQIIGADDYSTKIIKPPCPGVSHELNYGSISVAYSTCKPSQPTLYAPVRSWNGGFSTAAPFPT